MASSIVKFSSVQAACYSWFSELVLRDCPATTLTYRRRFYLGEVNKAVETALLECGRITIDYLYLRLARAKRVFPCGVCGSLSHKTHTNGRTPPTLPKTAPPLQMRTPPGMNYAPESSTVTWTAQSAALSTVNQGGAITRSQGDFSSSIDISSISSALRPSISDWSSNPFNLSDHFEIRFSLPCPPLTLPSTPPPPPSPFPDFSPLHFQAQPPLVLFNSLARHFTNSGHLISTLSNCSSPESLDSLLRSFYSILFINCSSHLRTRPSKSNYPPPVPWWSPQLQSLKSFSRKLRQSFQNSSPPQRAILKDQALQAKKEYVRALFKAKRRHFRMVCSSFTHNPWGTIHRFITRGSSRSLPLSSNSFQKSLLHYSIRDRLQTTLDFFFNPPPPPDSCPFHLSPYPLNPPNPPSDPPFTAIELSLALRRLRLKRSYGLDFLPGPFSKWLVDSFPNFFLNLFNTCFSLRHFPSLWKVGRLVLLPKKTDSDDFNSKCRPIVLLPILGKLLESLMAFRLSHNFESNGLLHPLQFGFRGDAPPPMLSPSYAPISDEPSPAFNAASSSAWISNPHLNTSGTLPYSADSRLPLAPPTLLQLYRSFLSNRSIHFSYRGYSRSTSPLRGCAQGSVSGPLLWNIFFNPLLSLPFPPGVHVQAFADDIQILVSGPSLHLPSLAQSALDLIHSWCLDNKLSLTPHKSLVLPIFCNPPQLLINGTPLSCPNTLTILGVTFDDRLSFTPHLHRVCEEGLLPSRQGPSMLKFSFRIRICCQETILPRSGRICHHVRRPHLERGG
ncbi:hypothetical protein LAZ67_22000005 [Cordylochernes scorpioides]|uniref:Reverse transcriptase domain-containing protein n=1 Tax=Cordylochernes scorpioides TaxID=51811 RepID=A0ABY6LQA8_9ARAC|nr:hypothetical protein LAZ67_22000005 [Cordylochernes scorpioides]